MPGIKAPNLWWSVTAYYALLFLVGVALGSWYDTPSEHSISDLVKIGLLVPILATMGFLAPFIEGDWMSWVLAISATGGLIFASLKLTGWTRWITVMSLIVCMSAYGLYLAARAGA